MDFKPILKCVGKKLSESELLQANGKHLRGQWLNGGDREETSVNQ